MSMKKIKISILRFEKMQCFFSPHKRDERRKIKSSWLWSYMVDNPRSFWSSKRWFESETNFNSFNEEEGAMLCLRKKKETLEKSKHTEELFSLLSMQHDFNLWFFLMKHIIKTESNLSSYIFSAEVVASCIWQKEMKFITSRLSQ